MGSGVGNAFSRYGVDPLSRKAGIEPESVGEGVGSVFGKGGAPEAPDYVGAAREQGRANVDAAIAQSMLNNPNRRTPFGNLTNTQTGSYNLPGYGAVPTYTQELSLDPQFQPAISNAAASIGRPFDPSNPSAYESAYLKRLEPQLERSREAMVNNLSIKGFKPGSTTYDTEMDQLRRQENDARSQAVTQGLQFDIAARNQPINELTALMSGSQVGLPQFQGSSVGAAPIANAINQQAQYGTDVWNAEQQRAAGMTNTAATLGAMYLLFSDRRLKKNIERIGELNSGLHWYRFEYLWGEKSEGVMADEAEKVFPEAVWEVMGFKVVDYGAIH